MAGLVLMPDGRDWTSSSSVFYWMLDTVAPVASQPLAGQLRLVSDNNLGAIDLGDLGPEQLAELRRILRGLGEVARRELPDTTGRELITQRAEELSAMVNTSLPRGVGGGEDRDRPGGASRACTRRDQRVNGAEVPWR